VVKLAVAICFQINSASPGFDSRPMQAQIFFLPVEVVGVVVVDRGGDRGC
jgi:hypothetical protein